MTAACGVKMKTWRVATEMALHVVVVLVMAAMAKGL